MPVSRRHSATSPMHLGGSPEACPGVGPAMLCAGSPALTRLRGSSVSGHSQTSCSHNTIWVQAYLGTYMPSPAGVARPGALLALRPRAPDVVGHELEHCRKRQLPTMRRNTGADAFKTAEPTFYFTHGASATLVVRRTDERGTEYISGRLGRNAGDYNGATSYWPATGLLLFSTDELELASAWQLIASGNVRQPTVAQCPFQTRRASSPRE